MAIMNVPSITITPIVVTFSLSMIEGDMFRLHLECKQSYKTNQVFSSSCFESNHSYSCLSFPVNLSEHLFYQLNLCFTVAFIYGKVNYNLSANICIQIQKLKTDIYRFKIGISNYFI